MNHDSATLLFLLLAAGMTAVALAFVLPRLWRGAPPRAPISRTAMNADIYRMELAELEAERDTGRLSAAEAAEARTELERRLLADAGGETGSQPRGDATRRAAVAIAVALPVLAAGLYLVFGEPGALATSRADAGFAATGAALTAPGMRAELVRHLERNPRDGRGWVLLGRAGRSRTTVSPTPPPPSNARSPLRRRSPPTPPSGASTPTRWAWHRAAASPASRASSSCAHWR